MTPIEVHVMRLADFTYPEGSDRAGEQGLVNGYLVISPAGPLLVDSGVGPPHSAIDHLYRPVRYDLDEALAGTGKGVRCRDIVAVTNCHLHFDHAGGNVGFSGRPIYAQAAEYEAAGRPGYTIPEIIDFPGARYELVDGRAEIAPGVTLLPTPGHSLGHQSVLLNTDDGLVVLGGQVAETVEGLAETPKDELSRRSLRSLLDLGPERIYLGHSAAAWTRGQDTAV